MACQCFMIVNSERGPDKHHVRVGEIPVGELENGEAKQILPGYITKMPFRVLILSKAYILCLFHTSLMCFLYFLMPP